MQQTKSQTKSTVTTTELKTDLRRNEISKTMGLMAEN